MNRAMTPMPDNDEKMERLIRATLRDLPARRAPRSLEARVLAELERRAALPWWRRSFVHWPMLARVAFVLGCAGLAKGFVMVGIWASSGFDAARFREVFAQQFAWMESGLTVVHAIAGCYEIMSRNIPALWLYGAIAFVVTMYLALFGLGAAAYKALNAQR